MKLSVGVLQYDIVWENPAANFEKIQTLLSANIPVDMIILPEMFSHGFSMNVESVAESEQGESYMFLQGLSKEHDCMIMASIPTIEKGQFYNRGIVYQKGQKLGHFDKRHLFPLSFEHESYAPGEKKLIVEVNGFRISPLICYDLRFPVWSRNKQDYDVLVYMANWPDKRQEHWETLLKARAIENQAYCLGVNRTGIDGNALSFCGGSTAIHFDGTILSHLGNEEGLMVQQFDMNELNDYRAKFPVWKSTDSFLLE